MFFTTLSLALRSIRRHLLRSFLTILGIVIGVGAVVTMVTLGEATTAAVQKSISALGTNILQVRPGQGFGRGGGGPRPPDFKPEDVTAIANQIAGVTAVAPQASATATAIYEGANWSTTINGTTNAIFQVQPWPLASGRYWTAAEESAGNAVCVIGNTVAKNLFPSGDPVGRRFRIGAISCDIVGVLTTRERFSTATVQASITDLLRERRTITNGKTDDFNIFDTKQISDTLTGTTTLLTGIVAAVAGISLVVGGIGIMNIMLVSVTERTREIGIRLAIGAVAREVLLQFLVEAIALSCLGGLIGLVIAQAAIAIISPLIKVEWMFDLQINVFAFAISAVIGVVFGYFPARRAAAMNPIDALRHE
jgi:putative ABC transport system permease protein